MNHRPACLRHQTDERLACYLTGEYKWHIGNVITAQKQALLIVAIRTGGSRIRERTRLQFNILSSRLTVVAAVSSEEATLLATVCAGLKLAME